MFVHIQNLSMTSRRILVALLVLVAVVSVRGRWKSCRAKGVKYGYTPWRKYFTFQCGKGNRLELGINQTLQFKLYINLRV